MKILFANIFETFTSNSIVYYLKKMGHEVKEATYYTPEDVYQDDRLVSLIKKDLKENSFDCVVTVNIWPLVARTCHEMRVPYLGWSYDSPQNLPTLQDLDYDTNFLFIFDRAEVEIYHDLGIEQVYHLPLAADLERWDKVKAGGKKYDVSLLGKLYESTLPSLLNGMEEYEQGYIKGLIEAQQKIYGYFMLDELITEDLMKRINQGFQKKYPKAEKISKRQLAYSMGSYLTYRERLSLLRLLGPRANVHLFSYKIEEETKPLLKDITIHGEQSYEVGMPLVFKESKVNLNPSLRIIRSGISLRCMDILGCGGFLLSSYQPELAEYFALDEEIVLYDSLEDAVAKATFYATHDEIREAIAQRGYERVKQDFHYPGQLQKMFDMAGLK